MNLQKKCWAVRLLTVFLLLAGLGMTACAASESSFFVGGETVTRTEQNQTLAGGSLSLRTWTLPGEDQCVMGAWQTVTTAYESQTLWQIETGKSQLTIRYYDGEQWIKDTLKEGIYDGSTAFFIAGDDFYQMYYTPQMWQLLDNGSRRLVDKRGWLKAEQTDSGWVISVCAPAMDGGCSADFLCLTSSEALVNWEQENTENLWKNYRNAGSGRWCYDGYYFEAPTTYVPAGDDVYYRSPAAYLLKSFAYQSRYAHGAWDLAVCMADVMLAQQNAKGFWPTLSESLWLSGSYGIGAGFYDTRFNSDLLEILVYLHNVHPSETYTTAMESYCDFYAAFAAEYGVETTNGGLLVPDYWDEDMATIPHTSLNHQLAECKVLYEMADILERDDLTALADRLLQGVRNTGLAWVRSDENLHYSVSHDGVYGGTDYPYLTYNDLYALQKLLTDRGEDPDPTLAALMEHKKAWMDANGVTGYAK
jgi:hypothetical protein